MSVTLPLDFQSIFLGRSFVGSSSYKNLPNMYYGWGINGP